VEEWNIKVSASDLTVSHLPLGDTDRIAPSEFKTDQDRIRFTLETIP